MIEPDRITHVLVDGVRYPDALRRLYARDDLAEIEPLYLLTRFKDVAEQGPILVAPRGRHFVDDILGRSKDELPRATSLITSTASTEALGSHLLGFMEIELEGTRRLLRFADPLVLRHWLASYGVRVPAEVMGPIQAWRVAHWAPVWGEHEEMAWQTFEGTGKGSPAGTQTSHPFDHFSASQLNALDAVARWQLKERLSVYFARHVGDAWSQLAIENRGDWLEARLDEALAWGAQTDRQLAIWMELSLLWGHDFMTASDGLHASWVAHDASRGHIPRQQQLYEIDAWWRSDEATQEAGNEVTRKPYHV